MTVRAFVTYSILRIMVFLGCLSALYLLGLREAKHLGGVMLAISLLGGYLFQQVASPSPKLNPARRLRSSVFISDKKS